MAKASSFGLDNVGSIPTPLANDAMRLPHPRRCRNAEGSNPSLGAAKASYQVGRRRCAGCGLNADERQGRKSGCKRL